MKKGLYIAFHDVDPAAGVSQKILNQVKSFNYNGVEMSLLSYRKKDGVRTAYIDDDEIAPIYSGIECIIHEIRLYPKLLEYIDNNNVKLLFIRYTQRLDYYYIQFLKKCKKRGCTILLEIPTYPYDGEFSTQSLSHKAQIIIERFFRRYLKKYVSFIVTSSEFDQILGIKTIRISNAVNPLDIKLRSKHSDKNNGKITLISVANISFWHGLDRLVKGLFNYYQQPYEKEVHIIIVGGGNKLEINKIKSLVEELNLKNYIDYVGPKHGEELDLLYDKADMAVGCMACHRKHIVEVKSLKNVEYAMRGLPFFYSENNTDFDDKPYVYKVPADDTDIDINGLIGFYNNQRMSAEDIRKTVTDLSWDNQIRKITEAVI